MQRKLLPFNLKVGLGYLFIWLLLAACGSSEETPPAANNTAIQNSILDLINKARAEKRKCGEQESGPVVNVKWNAKLEKAALNHANDMHKNSYFSHKGQNGSQPGDRVQAVGYRWGKIGENIAEGQTTERQVMNEWLLSEGHCKNIMSENYTEVGVARAGDIWVQVFAKPREACGFGCPEGNN